MFLSAHLWKTTNAFMAMKEKETQLNYYKRNHACLEVLQLVDLDSIPFKRISEQILSEMLQLGNFSQNGIEIKSARYWGKDDCLWFIQQDDYEFTLFALLDFHDWKVWCIKKSLLMDLRDKKFVTFQGNHGWTKKSEILPYLTPITTPEELRDFIHNHE